MKILKTRSGVEIKIYSSAKELTIARYSEFQKYLAMESSVESLEVKLRRAKAFIEEGQLDNTVKELDNAILSVKTILSGVSYLTYSFAILVAEIGLKVYSDITVEGLNAVISILKGFDLSMGVIEEEVGYVKKKLTAS